MNSQLQNKSEILVNAAEQADRSNYYPAVAHSAYYCCFQLLKHIWLHKMHKTEEELTVNCSQQRYGYGSHEFLINQIESYISNSKNKNADEDVRTFNCKIGQLKKLRIKADYLDIVFDSKDSSKSLTLCKDIIPILKKY